MKTWEDYKVLLEEQFLNREADSNVPKHIAKWNLDCLVECFDEEWIKRELKNPRNTILTSHPIINLLTSNDLESYISLNEIGSDLKFFRDHVPNDKLKKWMSDAKTTKEKFKSRLLEMSMYNRFKRIILDLEYDKYVTSKYPPDLVSDYDSIVMLI